MTEIKNRSAYHDYFIEDKYDAGMVLAGTEVKSIRDGKVSFVDSFCIFHKGELWVRNMHIAEYKFGIEIIKYFLPVFKFVIQLVNINMAAANKVYLPPMRPCIK